MHWHEWMSLLSCKSSVMVERICLDFLLYWELSITQVSSPGLFSKSQLFTLRDLICCCIVMCYVGKVRLLKSEILSHTSSKFFSSSWKKQLYGCGLWADTDFTPRYFIWPYQFKLWVRFGHTRYVQQGTFKVSKNSETFQRNTRKWWHNKSKIHPQKGCKKLLREHETMILFQVGFKKPGS